MKMMSITKLFLVVLRAFVTNSQIDEKGKTQFTLETLEQLFEIAKAHDVIQIVSEVLFQNGLLPEGKPITEKYKKHQINALYRYMNIEREQEMIYQVFEENGVDFVPLKGAVMRQYYPDPYMRTSCDIDILVHEDQLPNAVKVLESVLSYKSNDTVDFHDISLYSPSGVHLELHYNLKEKRDNLDKLLVRVWDYCEDAREGSCRKLESPEFFIFHHVAHMVNHFLRGGCGIRPFIDLYFIEKNIRYDASKLASFIKESEIDVFYRAALQCVDTWFGHAASTEIAELIEGFVLKGGVYGSRENRINLDQNKQGGKIKYFLSRIFIPYDTLKYKYPVLQKHPVLLPLMWIVRLFSLVSPQKRKRAKRELELHQNISDTAQMKAERMLQLLDI